MDMREQRIALSNFFAELPMSDITAGMLKDQVSQAIRKYRIDNDMSQKDLAEYLGTTQGMVSKYESSSYNFSLETIAKITEKLNLDVSVNIAPRPSEYEQYVHRRSYSNNLSNHGWSSYYENTGLALAAG